MSTAIRPDDRPDVHEMVVIHRVFRREFSLLPPLIRKVTGGDVSRAELVGSHRSLISRPEMSVPMARH